MSWTLSSLLVVCTVDVEAEEDRVEVLMLARQRPLSRKDDDDDDDDDENMFTVPSAENALSPSLCRKLPIALADALVFAVLLPHSVRLEHGLALPLLHRLHTGALFFTAKTNLLRI